MRSKALIVSATRTKGSARRQADFFSGLLSLSLFLCSPSRALRRLLSRCALLELAPTLASIACSKLVHSRSITN